jgi:hypothetical protein
MSRKSREESRGGYDVRDNDGVMLCIDANATMPLQPSLERIHPTCTCRSIRGIAFDFEPSTDGFPLAQLPSNSIPRPSRLVDLERARGMPSNDRAISASAAGVNTGSA